MTVEAILEVNRLLYPALPAVAMAMFVAAYFISRRYPTSSLSRILGRRRDLAVEVRTWTLDQQETVVHWIDYAALSKREIVATVGERLWFYRGQDMYAEGWPLYFTRDEAAAGSLEAEETRRRELQERTAVPLEDDVDPGVPPPTGVHRLVNLIVAFGAVTSLPLLLLSIPEVRADILTGVVLAAVAAAGAGPLVWSVARLRRSLRKHREAADRDRALRLHPEGTPERALVVDLRAAVPDEHGLHRLDAARYPDLDRSRIAAVARNCGWEVLGREDGIHFLGRPDGARRG